MDVKAPVFESKLPEVGTTIFTVMSALASQHQAINLSQGFPDFDCPEALKNLVSRFMKEGMNQYAPMPGVLDLRKIISEKIRITYRHTADPNTDITITAGATQAIFTAIATIVRPGDEVIIFEPAYDCYGPAVSTMGGKTISIPTYPPFYQIDFHLLENTITSKTRLIIFNTPNNPTGQTWSETDLENLAKIIHQKNIYLVSDEVYEHLVFDGLTHTSLLSHPELRTKGFAVYSFGKTFHNTGWKVGYVVGPEYLMKEFRKVHQFNVFSVNTPVQYALAEYLRDPDHYLSLPNFYQSKRDYFTGGLQKSRFRLLPNKGTYFVLADYSAISELPDIEFAHYLTIQHSVAAIPVSAFYSDPSRANDRILRFCFAKEQRTLDAALERLIPL